jgi:hypothetical protein
MEVIAIADRNDHWRWEIRRQGKVIKESRGAFPTLAQAITEGKLARGPETDESVSRSARPVAR